MTRDILLPTVGNIFMDDFQWKIIKKNTYDYFDNIIVFLNTPNLNDELISDYKKLYNDKKVIFLEPKNYFTNHNTAMEILARASKSTTSCFIESDFFIYDGKILGDGFKKIETEEIDFVGNPRGFCSPEILDEFRMQNSHMKYIYEDSTVWDWPNIEKWPAKSSWFAWWPCGFYAKNKIIKNYELYQQPNIKAGEKIKYLNDYMCANDAYFDTFAYGGLILSHNKTKFDIQNLDQFDETTGISSETLHHLIDIDHIQNVKYRSHHICNSSTQLNSRGLDPHKYDENSILLNDINTIKNIVIFDAFLNMYPNKNSSFYKLIRGKWDIYLNFVEKGLKKNNFEFKDIKSKIYIMSFDRILFLSDLYKQKFQYYYQ